MHHSSCAATQTTKEVLDISHNAKVVFGIVQISDPQAIRALAHPLRLDLLELLVTAGPATAAHCGRALGVPQANASFHLRQLAKYGFVEDAGPGRDRRERQWRVPDTRPTLRITAGSDAVVQRELQRLVVEREAQAILDFAGRSDDESAAWRQKAGLVTAVVVLSADEAAEIKEQWKALLEPYVQRTSAAGPETQADQRHVRYFMAATPLTHCEPGDIDNDNED